MLAIHKLGFGVQTHKKMLRLHNSWGEILDRIGATVPESVELEMPIPGTPHDARGYAATVRSESFAVKFGASFVYIVQSAHRQGVPPINAEKFLDKALGYWGVVNDVLRVRGIRRVGLVAEHRILNVPEPSKALLQKITKFAAEEGAAKFHLRYERRLPLPGGVPPGEKNSQFVNLIKTVYDSAVDEEPSDHAINANLDVQQYFDPIWEGGVPDQLKALYRKAFSEQWKVFQGELQQLGVIDK